ncbi:MAG: GTPase Era [Patescibacteria group bacterium]|nr:GTPase Era [Patescibacteria group bacterium]
MKSGRVTIVGRPNSGKSTLINAIIGKKISIVTNRPQTTRKIIRGVYWDDRGQIIFLDTPGVFAKIKDPIGKKVAKLSKESLSGIDLVVYLIDRCRSRGEEENRILGMVRKIDKPKILVVNKIDIEKPNQIHEYLFLKEEFDAMIEISALRHQHLKTLLAKIFELLPEGEAIFDPESFATFPAMNLPPKEFLSEIIREKAFMTLKQELPYTLGVEVNRIEEKENIFEIEATIFTDDDHHKSIIIGKSGAMIKEIGSMARKEIELITDKKVFLKLQVVTDRHWYQRLS